MLPWSAIIHASYQQQSNLRISRRRRVCQSDRAVDGVGTRVRLLILPHPPDTIDLCVVQVEPRVAIGCHKVAAWVASNREVPRGVHAHEAVSESRDAALHLRPETVDRLALEEAHDFFVVAPLPGGPGRDVALQAARVVA